VTEDIVTSLRRSAGWIKDLEHESWFGTADLQTDAADEIERLRGQLEQSRQDHLATFLELMEERCG